MRAPKSPSNMEVVIRRTATPIIPLENPHPKITLRTRVVNRDNSQDTYDTICTLE